MTFTLKELEEQKKSSKYAINWNIPIYNHFNLEELFWNLHDDIIRKFIIFSKFLQGFQLDLLISFLLRER